MYLSGIWVWTSKGAKVVPLTGDASDRRYFRILLRDEPSQVLAVHPGAIEFRALPFVNVYVLLTAMPAPVPSIWDTRMRSGSSRCRTSAM
jgi:hypothetical protein